MNSDDFQGEFKTFPLYPNSKEPLAGSHGYKDATLNCGIPEGYNYGVATGRENNLVVIDVDIKNGKDGFKSLADVGIDVTRIDTLTVKTPTEGLHLYFKSEGDYSCKTDILNGVDVRATGGYVVGPGSIIDGFPYKIEQGGPIATLPDSIEKLLQEKPRKSAGSGSEKEAKCASIPSVSDTPGITECSESIANLRKTLEKIDPSLPREWWCKAIWSALSEYGNTCEVVEALGDWSKRSSGKWDESDFNKVVDSFDPSKAFEGLSLCKNAYPNKGYFFSNPKDAPKADLHAREVVESTIAFLVKKGNKLNADHEQILEDIATALSYSYFAEKGKGKRTLIPAFPGAGKSQTVVTHSCKVISEPGLDRGLWISVATIEEIDSIVDSLVDRGIPRSAIGIKHSKRGSNVTSTNAEGYQVILTTHERIRSCEYSNLISYKGQSRQLIWDEALLSTATQYLNLDELLTDISVWKGKLDALRLRGESDVDLLETEQYLDALLGTLRSCHDKTVVEIPEHPGELNLSIHTSKTLSRIKFKISKEAYVDKQKHIFNWYVSVDDELENIVILDASGRERKLTQFDSSIRIYPIKAEKDYCDCKLIYCRAYTGKYTINDPTKNLPMFQELAHIIKGIVDDPNRPDSVACFHLPEIEGVEYAPTRLATHLGAYNDAVTYRSWGASRGVNSLKDETVAVHIGMVYRDDNELATAIAGQKRNTLYESNPRELHMVKLSEHAEQVYQAFNRMRCRETINGKASAAEMYLFYPDEQILEILERLMPGIQIVAYEPKYLKRQTSGFDIAGKMLTWLEENQPAKISMTRLRQEVGVTQARTSKVWIKAREILLNRVGSLGYELVGRSLVKME